MSAPTLFDLDEEAPAVAEPEPEEADDHAVWVMPLKDPQGAFRQQLQAWGRRKPSPMMLRPSLARESLEAAGRLFLAHGMRARWMLCSPAIAEALTPQVRARVDKILKAAGLEATFDEDLFS